MRRFLFAALFAALSLPLAAQARDAAETDVRQLEGIAAIVNDKPVSYSDVRQRARLLLLMLGGDQPSQQEVQQITGQALEQLIDERLQLDRVERFEIEIAQPEIDAALSEMGAQFGLSGQDFRRQLQLAGVNPASLEDQIRAEAAWNRLMNGLYGSRIRVSDNQIDDQMNRLRAALQRTQYRVGEIFLYAPDAESRSQARQAADSILRQIQQGADFRIAAQRISSAPTAATGGDMGWITPEDLAPELAEAVRASGQEGLLPPIETENGVYLLGIFGVREPSAPVTRVDLKRLVATDGSEAALIEAMERISSCADVNSVANSRSNLRAADIDDINVAEMGPEGQAMVLATEVGKPTDIFAIANGLAVMYVCRRTDGAEALPSREDLRNSIRSRELSMISDRELRNSRREATIIYR